MSALVMILNAIMVGIHVTSSQLAERPWTWVGGASQFAPFAVRSIHVAMIIGGLLEK